MPSISCEVDNVHNSSLARTESAENQNAWYFDCHWSLTHCTSAGMAKREACIMWSWCDVSMSTPLKRSFVTYCASIRLMNMYCWEKHCGPSSFPFLQLFFSPTHHSALSSFPSILLKASHFCKFMKLNSTLSHSFTASKLQWYPTMKLHQSVQSWLSKPTSHWQSQSCTWRVEEWVEAVVFLLLKAGLSLDLNVQICRFVKKK